MTACFRQKADRRAAAATGHDGRGIHRLVQAHRLEADLALRMAKVVGFRNIAVHACDSIDWNIVFAIATGHLRDFE